MQSKRDDHQAGEEGGQELVAMPIIVGEVVAMVFQGIVGFIFNLPAAPPGDDRGLNRGGGERMIRDKTVRVDDLAGPFHGSGQFHPIHMQRVIPSPERDVTGPLIEVEFPAAIPEDADGFGLE